MRLIALLVALPLPVWGQTPLTGAQYNAIVSGGTFVINEPGQEPYGIEAYLPNQQVMWGYIDGECTPGYWYEDAPGTVCYEYEGFDDGPTCWNYYMIDGQFLARLADSDNDILYQKVETDLTVDCVTEFLGS